MPWQVNRQGATKCRLHCAFISCVPALLCALRTSFRALKGSLARLPPSWKGTVRKGKSEGGGELYLLVLKDSCVCAALCTSSLLALQDKTSQEPSGPEHHLSQGMGLPQPLALSSNLSRCLSSGSRGDNANPRRC